MIPRRFQSPLPLLVSQLSLHSTCTVFVLYGLFTLGFLSFCLHHTSVPWHCNIYSLFLSRIMISGLMLVTVLSVCTCSVHSTVSFITCCCYFRYCTRSHLCSLFDFTTISPYICYSAVQHTLCRVSLCTVLPVPGVLIWCDLFLFKLFTESAVLLLLLLL
jgi:hypothetical protein